jgi:hypothetical protein
MSDDIESMATFHDGHTHWFGENFVRRLLARIEMLKQELITTQARIRVLEAEEAVHTQQFEEMRKAHNKTALELARLVSLLEGGED